MADADAVLSTVLCAVLSVLLLLAVAATVALAHKTVRHWRGEQAGRVYELPVDLRGTVLRAGAAGTAAVVAATLAMALVDTVTVGPGATTAASGPTRDLAAVAGTTPATSVPPRSGTGTAATPPPPPPRTPEPAPPPPEVRTIGHPAGGTLQVMGDGTRVWLPPLYGSARAADLAYPVVVARVPADGRDAADLYQGFARAALRKKADLFILVSPVDCHRDSASVLAEAARRYRTLSARSARGLLGAGPDAPCAVREALSGQDRFGAAAGVSGTYTGLPTATATAAAGTATAHPPLLLATAAGEPGPRASALRLKRALHPSGDAVRTVSGGSRRRDLYGQVAGYMTEKLDGPTRLPSTPTHPAPSTPPPAPHH